MNTEVVRGGRFNPVALVFFLTAMALLALALMVPRGHEVLWLNGLHSRYLDALYPVLTNAGDGVLFVPLVLILLFVRFQLALGLLATALIHGLLVSVFKRWLLAGATRPIIELDPAALHLVPGVDVHAHHSFPSGHTASIFAIGFFLALMFDRKISTALFLALALLVASSRIYLVQHFLSDVAAGACIGVVSVVLAIWGMSYFGNSSFLQRRFTIRKPTLRPGDAPLR